MKPSDRFVPFSRVGAGRDGGVAFGPSIMLLLFRVGRGRYDFDMTLVTPSDRNRAVIAGFLGWTLDAFDFSWWC